MNEVTKGEFGKILIRMNYTDIRAANERKWLAFGQRKSRHRLCVKSKSETRGMIGDPLLDWGSDTSDTKIKLFS